MQTTASKTIDRPRVIGHRGAAGHAPENTLPSIDKALTLGADWIEIDVQLARGIPVVTHDRRLRDASQTLVADITAEALPAIPTLDALIRHLNRRATLNIELKAVGSALATAAVLRRYLLSGWQADNFLLSSFNQHELMIFAQCLPGIRRGLLLGGIPLDYAAAAQAQDAWSIHLSLDFVTAEFVADAKRRGLRVFVYTVNHAEDAAWLLEMGVDGLFSDYPERMRAVIDGRLPRQAA